MKACYQITYFISETFEDFFFILLQSRRVSELFIKLQRTSLRPCCKPLPLHFPLYFQMLRYIYLYCYYSSLLVLVVSTDVELLEKCWGFMTEEREDEQELGIRNLELHQDPLVWSQ
ncbi:unnamed protein product [Caretta caretta]